MMKTTIKPLLLLASLLLTASVFAQVPMTQQINQIKRDSTYLYAEATMADADEALAVAKELLLQQVQEYVNSKPELARSNNVLVKDIGSNSESLSMMRGTMYRMFVYVDKRDIEVVNNAVTIQKTNTVQPVESAQAAEPMVAEKPVAEEQTTAKEEHQAVKKGETDDTKPEPKVEPEGGNKAGVSPAIEMPQWQLDAISSLLTCSNINEALSKLKRFKAQYKIKDYGAPQQCRSISDSYWIVFGNDGSVVEVLSPGEGDRIGFKTNTQVTLDNYKGMDAIWFKFAK